MKAVLLTMLLGFKTLIGAGQSYEIEVLLLNFEKLNQLRQILSDMKSGYEIISQGYGMIKNIAEGNFSLHNLFLDKMMEASPAVKNNYRIAEIIALQVAIVREYKDGWRHFRNSKWLRAEEVEYIGNLYSELFKKSVESLDALAAVISGRQFRMSDDERLQRLDRIHKNMQVRLIDIRKINSTASGIIDERERNAAEIDVMKSVHGIE